ncbi:MAG: phosphatidylserine decarboxylase [Gammaproteobacteria bacterium]|nr:phosphatidylserine decarboxylase [Gammaproteobacteria bacterium]
MPSNSYPLIAREGWPVLGLLLGLFLVLQYLEYHLAVTTLLLGIIFLAVFLHRDPFQQIPPLPLAVVSPVHGTVMSVLEIRDPFLDRPALCIRIKMRPWDIFSLRSPIEGKVMNQWSRSDTVDRLIKTSYAFWIQSDEGDHVVTSIHLNKPRWRYHFYMQSGQRLGQGQRCGFLYFGTEVEVMVPLEVKLEIETGQRVCSGATPLALLVHEEAVSAFDGPNRSSQASA